MNLKLCLLAFLLIIVSSSLQGKTYYVSKSGSDSNPGTFEKPWATWQKGFNFIVAGDTLYIRGGVYTLPDGVTHWTLSKDGTAQNKVCVFNYPGEKPILDRTGAKGYAWGRALQALSISGDYCHVRGLTVRNLWQALAGDDCFGISVGTTTGVIVENCTAYNIGGSGFIIGGAANLKVINCDVYNCNDILGDPEMPGQDGYGFNVSNVYVTSGSVTFTNCRAWKCSDDGWALYSVGYVEFNGCFSFLNGMLDGGGDGFKLGFMPPEPYCASPVRVIRNCVAAYNKNAGITSNDNNTRAVTFNAYNNTMYKNSYGIILYNTSDNDATENLRVFRNNISYASTKGNIFVGSSATYTHSHNTWDTGVTVTNDDYISIDTTGLTAVRQYDGSLPNNSAYTNFLRLANGSDLIDRGINVGLPYVGSAPDLGWSEYSSGLVYVSSVISNATPSMLEMTYSTTLANIVPAASAFTVQVNSVTRTVNSVSISGTKVLLTLASPVVYGNTVTVSYTKPATNPLQTSTGAQASSISARTVTNNVAGVNPVYVSSVIANATPSILEMTYSTTLANIVPAASAFTVQVNSVTRTVSSVSISGIKVLLTLASPVVYGNTVTVAYTKPTTNPLQTSTGAQASSITAKSVLNNCLQNQPPKISITSPVDNSTFKAPATITITVDAYDSDGTINKVQFFSGSSKIGEVTSAPYSFTWQNVPIGKYSITAIATDNLLSTTASNAVALSVRNNIRLTKGAPEIQIIEPKSGEHFIAPATIDIIVDSYDPDGIITRVEYYIGSTKIGESFQAPYSISFEGTTAGSHKITSTAYDELDDIIASTLINVYFDAVDPLKLYPNPNDGHFSVESLIPLQNSENVVNIVNSAGKIVYRGSWLKEVNTLDFDLSHLDSGIYIMIIKSHEILFTKKIIKK
jgi:uncharacterized repeat protein (TIGR02059 family)